MQSWVDISAPINWNDPLNAGLRHWWHWLPGYQGGFTWRDLTRRRDATLSGGASFQTAGRPAAAAGCSLFDGVNDYGQTAATDLSGTSTLMLCAWLYWNAYANDNLIFLETSDNSSVAGRQGALSLMPNFSTGVMRIAVNASGSAFSSASIVRPSAAAWHHLCFGFNRAAGNQQVVAAYVDGRPVTLTAVANNATSTGGFGNWAWNFMSRNGTSLFGAGRINDFRVFERLLSDPQVLTLYRQSMTEQMPQLRWVGRSRFAEAQAGGAPTTSPHYYRRRQRAA